MFSAKPIIACVDAGSDSANSILEAGCGWVIEPDNSDALTNLIQQIISMRKEDLLKMGLKGRNYALDHFSQHANLSKLVDIIEETVTK